MSDLLTPDERKWVESWRWNPNASERALAIIDRLVPKPVQHARCSHCGEQVIIFGDIPCRVGCECGVRGPYCDARDKAWLAWDAMWGKR